MLVKIKAALPLAIVIGVLAIVWTEVALNFTFHWVTAGDLGNGLSLPDSFHLVLPAAFVSWGFFFAAGADTKAFNKVLIGSLVGSVAGLATMAASSATAPLPDFWGIALWVGIFAVVLVLLTVGGDWYYVPATFGAFASVFFWWIATGLDGWAKDGGGVGNSVPALKSPATAGTGAFGGVLSTPIFFVWLSITVTLVLGCLLGVASARLTALVTPAAAPAEAAEPARR